MTSSQTDAAKWQELLADFLGKNPQKPLITVIGPTASGKTNFSILLAHHLQTLGFVPEIINADSRQVYTHLDIGTAKITEKEMEGIPHHLLSVLDPKEECTIAWFKTEVEKTIARLHSEKKIPILVGGSMLYVSAIVDGLEPMQADPELRDRLSKEYDADAGMTLFKRLEEIDPDSAATIPQENKKYVVRALEIFESTGVPKSKAIKKSASPYDNLIIGIDRDKEELNERIALRTEAMFQAGWIDEVKSLMERGYSKDDPAMQSHGYREIIEFLTLERPSLAAADLAAPKDGCAQNKAGTL